MHYIKLTAMLTLLAITTACSTGQNWDAAYSGIPTGPVDEALDD